MEASLRWLIGEILAPQKNQAILFCLESWGCPKIGMNYQTQMYGLSWMRAWDDTLVCLQKDTAVAPQNQVC